ncbi:hypothetical protein ACHQM5_002996 [Ranunculus cassubicifolius]
MKAFNGITILMFLLATIVADEGIEYNGLPICGVPHKDLMSCKPSVTVPTPSPPSPLCCSTVSHLDIKCICRMKVIASTIGIDVDLAKQLPKKCNLPIKVPC